MSAYDITRFLRTAYRPFAYCVPPKHPLNTAYQRGGGVTLIYIIFEIIKRISLRKKHTKSFFSECLLCLGILRVLCCFVCLFLYGPFCHGAHKLNKSTLFKHSMDISSIYIIT